MRIQAKKSTSKLLANPAPQPTPQVKVNRTFTYDGFNRLTNSQGWLYDNVTPPLTKAYYSDTMTYDTAHNIMSKIQLIQDNVSGFPGGSAAPYSFAYTYNGPAHPHQIANIVDNANGGLTHSYTYDLNGNMTGVSFGGSTYAMSWNEENQMLSWVYNNGGANKTEKYWYNDAGTRIVKQDTGNALPSQETLYFNQFLSVLMDDTTGTSKMYTKNYFAGNERVSSALFVENGDACCLGNNIYYYHTDHLGSNTYMTDVGANIREHIEYTPWGESWEEENNLYQQNLTQTALDYMFTGKELDSVTGLYYYGARYYDPQASVWMSTDPALPNFINSYSGGGGVFNSLNLGIYSYGQQNPVRYTDPSGREGIDTTFDSFSRGASGGAIEIALNPEAAIGAAALVSGGLMMMDAIDIAVNDTGFLEPPIVNQGIPIDTAQPTEGGYTITSPGEVPNGGLETYPTAQDEPNLESVPASPQTSNMHKAGGENKYTQAGRQAHKDYQPGEGFQKEQTLKSGKRPDAVNYDKKIVKELKPNNPEAIKKGTKQVEGYKQELQQQEGGEWKSQVDTYDQQEYLNK